MVQISSAKKSKPYDTKQQKYQTLRMQGLEKNE
jgi:hypothetical protein